MKKHLFALLLMIMGCTTVFTQEYRIIPLPINHRSSNDIAPFVKDSVLYFSSNRRSSIFVGYFDQHMQHLYRWYSVEMLPGGKFGTPKPFLAQYQSKLNNGPFIFSRDGNTLLATQSTKAGITQRSANNGIVAFASADGKDWGMPSTVIPPQNKVSVGQPAISPDGKILVFASNQPGMGKTDLFLCKYENGGWGEATNLGEIINTSGNEVFPFFHPSGKLYFSSDGHRGSGGLDIYYTVMANGQWTTPVALPEPINSGYDDFGIYMATDYDSGFFTSNRERSDNIYSFVQLWPSFDACEPQEEDNYCFELYEDGVFQSDTLPVRYVWDFGDGEIGTGKTAQHCFPGPGNYHITLTAIDTLLNVEMFKVADYTMEVTRIEQVVITAPPVIKKSQTATFHAKESYLPDTGPYQYFWELGDGSQAKGLEVSHSFKAKGTFVVKCGMVSEQNPHIKYCSALTIEVTD
ncbi:MAG: PKD domain-containing protein [Breznakibacter sp.]